MTTLGPDITAALASLEARWGAAAPRRLGEVVGSLATVPLPEEPLPPFDGPSAGEPARSPAAPGFGSRPDDGRIVPTGFAGLDAILGPGGLPHDAAVAVRGDGTSGKTTLALRLAAEAQAAGSIVAYLDLARSLDPVEAVARGVRLEWLVVLAPATVDEGLAMAGALVQGRAVDLLVVDLPDVTRLPPAESAGTGHGRGPSVGDRLQRLGALARRAGTMLVVLEPPGLPSPLRRAVDGSTGFRLELARRSWIRLGRDVVGQWTEAVVARSRVGPPGRRADLRILYADGGDRDACLRRDELLGPDAIASPAVGPAGIGAPGVRRSPSDATGPSLVVASAHPLPITTSLGVSRTDHDATPPPPLVPSLAPARPAPPRLRLVPDGPHRSGRRPLGRRSRPRYEPGGARAGRPPRDAARERAPARA
jgi:RecA/RadA recombinase